MMGKIILIGGALVIISTFSFADVGQANALEQITPLNKCKINGELVPYRKSLVMIRKQILKFIKRKWDIGC